MVVFRAFWNEFTSSSYTATILVLSVAFTVALAIRVTGLPLWVYVIMLVAPSLLYFVLTATVSAVFFVIVRPDQED